MSLRILVTGGDGMLATDLYKVLTEETTAEVYNLSKQQLDITSKLMVDTVLSTIQPDIVVHTAALTNVDLCQDHPDEADYVNVRGTENVSKAAEQWHAKMVYISSCGLFGDTVRAYSECDEVVLKTSYARSKYGGEKRVQEVCEKSYIIRPGWLFGGSISHKKNFVYNRYLEAKSVREIKSAVDKIGTPTYTRHLGRMIVNLIQSDDYGLYHITNQGHCSRYEYVKHVVSLMNLDTEVLPVSSALFQRSAPVPDCEVLENQRLVQRGYDLLPTWEEALEEYVHTLKWNGRL